MPEESTTPDLVELSRDLLESANRRDFDAALSFYAPDVVWEGRELGAGFEGAAALRRFFDDWSGAYEEFEVEPEEILELGNGVVFAVIRQNARPAGSTGYVEMRYAAVTEWTEGMIVRITNYLDIDEARAAAERLAEERG
jgi:ketosteroid isomerase-like protein